MANDPLTKFILENMIDVTAAVLMPLMFVGFGVAVLFRVLIYYTAKAELKFTREFEKRARNFFSDPNAPKIHSFYYLLKKLLEKTYHECFEMRSKYKRRSLDHVTTMTDRFFLIQDGVQRLVHDTLRQARYLKKEGYPPKMVDVTKSVFETNPVFNKVMGIFPTSLVNELLNILPGLLIIAGIFGTFLGIAKGLPELGGMDLSNMEETKRTMDFFLIKISQAMVKSIVGIALSVLMSLVNTLFAPEAIYYNLVNRFADSLEAIWNETTDNVFDKSEYLVTNTTVGLPKNASEGDKRGVKTPPAPPAAANAPDKTQVITTAADETKQTKAS